MAAFLLTFSFIGISNAYSSSSFSNLSSISSPFSGLIPGLPVFALERRQELVCEVPGGPICDAIHCCGPGMRCCPSSCCPSTSNCLGAFLCCSQGNQICDGKACCPRQRLAVVPHAACPARPANAVNVLIKVRERHAFVCSILKLHPALKDKVIRFDLSNKNKEVLKNMCNGMRGKNTETLTYRGQDKAERDQTRRDAGCVDRYCATQIQMGLAPATHNSCDEYPPASSLEGGNARSVLERAVNCIPARENSSQGGKFGGFQSTLRKLGMTFQRGDKFVISINCDEVLGSLVPKQLASIGLERRDPETITSSGNETVDDTLRFEEDQTLSYLLVPLGDLSPGSYSASIKCTAGSTVGAYVLDNEGFNITTNDTGITTAQVQQLQFTLEYATPGIGVLIGTTDNSTSVTWNFEGTIGIASTSLTDLPTASATVAGSAAVQRYSSALDAAGMITSAVLIFLYFY